ncbi:hypothetical protein Patl1_30003 [Pistacia atlantica]|uniref:Uncharacterized protein n=1 Tax=Pistacia atlantica TaxID=434234 RepID=A0ACC1AD65_9ROSI|nr:hypothetical protein Patl1_30003 [Pistacia atlantica]
MRKPSTSASAAAAATSSTTTTTTKTPWSLIAGRIPGRTDNEIKNYWNTHLSKKLISQGIDPRTHKPLSNNNDHQNQSSSAEANPHKASSSSSKANRRTNPNPNSNPVISSSHLEDHHNDTTLMMMNTSQQHQQLDHETGNGYTGLLNGEDESRVVGLRNIGHHHNEEDEDINYCSDDVLSSFLNSLINEDAFAAQHQALQLQQQQQHNQPTGNTAQLPDPLVSISATAFGLGASWESPLMASSFSQNEHKKVVNDRVE